MSFNWQAQFAIPPGFREVVVVDIETRSALDVTKVGLARYARSPTTEIIIVSWKRVSTGEVLHWDLSQPIDGLFPFLEMLEDPEVLLIAYNSPFERELFKWVWGIDTSWSRWQDAMIYAYAHCFTGKLSEVCKQMEMPEDLAKDPKGDALIHKFSKTRGHKTGGLYYWDHTSAPEAWADFVYYCIRDTECEYRIAAALADRWPIPDWLWDQWRLDLKINDRGVPLDAEVVQGALTISEEEIEVQMARIRELTGIANPNSRDQMLTWLQGNGVPRMPDLRKETVTAILADGTLDGPIEGTARKVLEARQMTAKTNWKKYEAMDRAVHVGRVRGMFQYFGASRTGRDAGRVVQLQNLARGGLKDPVTAADVVALGRRDLVHALYPESVMDVLTGTLRCAITAEEGKVFTVADLKSIESCVIAWLANCHTITELFYAGKDTYKAFAVEYFGVPYEQVTKQQRSFCKPPVLGAGYGLGWRGLIGYAASMGVVLLPDEAKRMIDIFRSIYWEIPDLWKHLKNAAFAAIENPGTWFVPERGRCAFYCDDTFLQMKLPSGRSIYYFQPKIVEKTIDGDNGPWTAHSLSYMGIDQKATSQKWKRIAVAPGSIAENETQAVARDILYYGLERMAEVNLPTVLHVHDETGNEVPEIAAESALAMQIHCMTQHPPWAGAELFLGAEGFITKRYRKD